MRALSRPVSRPRCNHSHGQGGAEPDERHVVTVAGLAEPPLPAKLHLVDGAALLAALNRFQAENCVDLFRLFSKHSSIYHFTLPFSMIAEEIFPICLHVNPKKCISNFQTSFYLKILISLAA